MYVCILMYMYVHTHTLVEVWTGLGPATPVKLLLPHVMRTDNIYESIDLSISLSLYTYISVSLSLSLSIYIYVYIIPHVYIY